MDKIQFVDVSFRNITYTVSVPGQKAKKNVLNSVSGEFKTGELTAIMGPSGAGKSSLLNILTGFTKRGVKGDISFGSISKAKEACNYILQEDNFFPWFTVEEVMLLAATLKISNKSLNIKQKQMLIENIIDTLRLSTSKQTKCGLLSGGQKKRLSIALELIDNPSVLFLDEPTTGLDSSASMDTMRLLKNLCKQGRNIICTIHQPSASLFQLFSHVYVLDRGQCVYQGSPKNTVPFLSSIGIPCPQYHNPSDFLLEVVTGEYGNYTQQMIETTRNKNWRYDSEHMPDSIMSDQKKDTNDKRKGSLVSASWSGENARTYPPSEWIKLWVLIGRCHIQFYRDWTVTHLKLALHIICAITIGLLFGDSGNNAKKSISNVSLLLVCVVYLWFTTMMPGILRFPLEIATIKKETFNSWYKLRTYYLAALITSTPVHIIFATVFSTITYYMTDQPFELERYVKFALINIMLTITADGFGTWLGSVANPVNGTFVGSVLTCFMLIYSGFLIFFNDMPSYMRAISYLSAHRYGLESMVLTLYGNDRSDMICPSNEIYCHLKNPGLIIKQLGMTGSNYNFDVVMLLLQVMFFKGMAYFSLRKALRTGN